MKLILSTNTNAALARVIARMTGIRMGSCSLGAYPDKEVSVRIGEPVEGKEVFVVGSTFAPAEHMLSLAILINTARIHGARAVNVIIPYFAYAKSDKVDAPGSSVSAGVMADILASAGATRVLAVGLHSSFVNDRFEVPLIELSPMRLLADAFKAHHVQNIAVVSPDEGGVHRAREFAACIGAPDIITVAKIRKTPSVVKVARITGEVRGKNVVLVDDMVQSGDTLLKAMHALRREGAKDVYVAVSHAVQSGPGLKRILRAREIKRVFVTDSIPFTGKIPAKCEVASIAPLIADALIKPPFS